MMNRIWILSLIGAMLLMLIGCERVELTLEYDDENLRLCGMTEAEIGHKYVVTLNGQRTLVTFQDTTPPVIQLKEGVPALFVLNECLCTEFYDVTDAADSNVSVRISGIDLGKEGWYVLTLQAEDRYGNRAQVSLPAVVREKRNDEQYREFAYAEDQEVVRIPDEIPPTITPGREAYEIEDISELVIEAAAYDEYDGRETEVTYDLSELKGPGTYRILLRSEDQSGNVATEYVEVIWKTDNKPKSTSGGSMNEAGKTAQDGQSEEGKGEKSVAAEEEKHSEVSAEEEKGKDLCPGGYDPYKPCHFAVIDGVATDVIVTEGLDAVFPGDSSLNACRMRGEELRTEGHSYLCWIIGRNDYQDWGSYLRVDK